MSRTPVHTIELSPNKPSALTDWAYTTIKESVLSLKLPPGAQLDIGQMAEQMGTSRTPVREALLRLERDGLIRVAPRVGFFVTEITKTDLRELFEMREMLESRATRDAGGSLSDQDINYLDSVLTGSEAAVEKGDLAKFLEMEIRFHNFIMEHAHNSRLVSMMESLRDLTYRERIISIQSTDNVRATMSEHRKILQAIRDHDANLASQLMSEHIFAARDRIVRLVDAP